MTSEQALENLFFQPSIGLYVGVFIFCVALFYTLTFVFWHRDKPVENRVIEEGEFAFIFILSGLWPVMHFLLAILIALGILVVLLVGISYGYTQYVLKPLGRKFYKPDNTETEKEQ